MNVNPDQFGGPGGQGRLFMTPQEIKQGYQPWDGDRHAVMQRGLRPHTGMTDRPEVYTGQDLRDAQAELHYAGYDFESQRTTGGSWYAEHESLETDDQLYSRKVDEAHDYGLYGDIEDEGVKNPIRLTDGGRWGKGTIVDGHHRLASADDINPDDLIPVMNASHFYDPTVRGHGGRGLHRGLGTDQALSELPGAAVRHKLGTQTNAALDRLRDVL